MSETDECDIRASIDSMDVSDHESNTSFEVGNFG